MHCRLGCGNYTHEGGIFLAWCSPSHSPVNARASGPTRVLGTRNRGGQDAIVWQNRTLIGSTLASSAVKAGAKVLQIFTPFDPAFTVATTLEHPARGGAFRRL